MNLSRALFRFGFWEVIILLLYLLILNYYLEKVDRVINADGVGYYDYLPSLFIHHDIHRKDKPIAQFPDLYERLNQTGVYNQIDDFKVNMYPVGVSFLQLPFFAAACFQADLHGDFNDGYQQIFQNYVFYGALFYLFLGLVFIRILLISFGIKPPWIVLIQLLLVLATPISYYVHYEAAFSHVYSFFAIAAFSAFTRLWFLKGRNSDFLFAAAFFALVLILRQVNGLVLFYVPFLAGSSKLLNIRISDLFSKKIPILILSLLIFGSIVFIQLGAWYLQSGKFILYSYQGYGFNWLDPYFFSILFSFRKGLFIYTPILLLSFGYFWYWIKEKNYYALFSWLIPFLLITYVLSSWGSWFYGCSYGLRAYIDFFPFFFIPIALLFQRMHTFGKALLIPLAIMAISLNLVQTMQYRNYILHWIEMDYEKYKKVFLKTDERYYGILFQESFDNHAYAYEQVKRYTKAKVRLDAYSAEKLLEIEIDSLISKNQALWIRVEFESDFDSQDRTRFFLVATDRSKDTVFQWHERYILHFAKEEFNKRHKGWYDFKIIPELGPFMLKFEIWTQGKAFKADNLSIALYRRK